MAAKSARPSRPGSLAAERLQLVLELGRRVTSILDLDALLPEACRLIAEAFAYDVVGINLVDPLEQRWLYQAAAHPPELTLPRSFRVPLGRGLTGWVARHGRPRLANDVADEPLYLSGPGRNTRSELDVPLKVGGRTIGVLNVESERVNAFSEDDVPYLEGLASQLAQAIENARLAAHSRQLAAAEERARLARDLHDETVQALVAIRRQLDLLELDLDERARAVERLEALHALVDRTLEGVRRLSRNLRPAVLEDLGLVAALRAHADELARLGLRVEVAIVGAPRRLPAPAEHAAYRVAQEALSNVARHAGVAEARLELTFAAEELAVTVEDRGAGATLSPGQSAGQGLAGMRDRAAEIGADLQVCSAPGAGTTVRLAVPLKLTLVDRL
ncbi:MAG: GAF domain-containing protein [Chloroflexi bacterium]|nr:GAF domain-containing protein [Chloroflexota bacterium]